MLVYSERWASPTCEELLQAYCLYCVFMGLNGVSEAFAFAKGNEVTLQKLRWLMVLNSIGYISLSFLLSQRLGIVGLVYANCVNMFLRATSCVYYTFHQMGKSMNETVLFFLSIFTGKIYVGLVALAFFGCSILQAYVLPRLLPTSTAS